MEGTTYVGMVLGSDKTTVSVATGHVEYHPLYLSIGNIHNSMRCAHRNSVMPIAFLAILKCEHFFNHIFLCNDPLSAEWKYDHDPEFWTFKCQLYHASISTILQSLKPGMMMLVIQQCPDGHYHRIIYDLTAYIVDYPEQCMLAGIVQNWCAKLVCKVSIVWMSLCIG